MNTYTWVITQLDCIPSIDGQINVVSNIHWHINATDGTNKTAVYGTQPLTFNANDAFIDYSDLTKNVVIKWVQEAMGANAIAKLQKAMDEQLEILAKPPITPAKLPWLA